MLRYRLLLFVIFPFLLIFLIWYAIRHQQSNFFWQRISCHLNHLPEKSLWIHCASVGEVVTTLPLIKEIFQQHPDLKIIVTTATITGAKIIRQQSFNNLFHCYQPFDCQFTINRFLKQLQPRALLVVETEIWPNLFRQCHKKNCPVTIINARLSTKTTTAKTWIKSLLKTSLQYANKIYTRSEIDKQAYLELGAEAKKIQLIGNLKYSKKPVQPDNKKPFEREFVLLASSHDDEESQIAQCWKRLNRHELLLIAPRHPQRCPTIIRSLQQQWPQLTLAIHSQHDKVTDDTHIYLLDTVGELMTFFPHAKLVIMGGSFVDIGGHNILEPAQFGRAIICGPYMRNFKDEVDLLLSKNALLQLNSFDELEKYLPALFSDNNKIQTLEKNASEISEGFEHIVTDYAHIVNGILKNN